MAAGADQGPLEQLFGMTIRRIPTTRPVVSLTFDDTNGYLGARTA